MTITRSFSPISVVPASPACRGRERTAFIFTLFTITITLLLALPSPAQQKGQRTQRTPAAAPPAAHAPKQHSFVFSSPRGMYVSCGLTVASPAHPVRDTVGYRIERRAGRESWSHIADISAAPTLSAFIARVGNDPVDAAVRRMKLAGQEAFWDALLASPRLEKILITPDRPVLEALGLLYLDTTAVRGTTYEYRVSLLLASGQAVRPRESAAVECGTPWPMTVMRVALTEESDTSARITWSAPAPRPAPSHITVFRRMSGQEDFTASKRPVSTWVEKDTFYCAIHEKDLHPSQQYEYYAVPEDFFSNPGPASEAATVFTVNFSRLPMPQNLATAQDTFGLRVSWTTDITEHLIATRIYRSLQYDTGYVKVGEVPATETSWLDAGAVGMTRYFYKLANLSYNNHESQKTGAVFGYGRSPIPPSTPQRFTAAAVPGGVAMHWDRNAEPDIAGYYVCRATSSRDSLIVITPLLTDTTYVDSSRALKGSTQYQYAVLAVNTSQLRSGFSNVEILRPAIATDPMPPRALYASPRENGIALNWNDPRAYDETVIGYVVYRAEPVSGREPVFTALARMMKNPEITSLFDSTVVPGRRYLYAVSSVDVFGGEGKRTSATEARIRIVLPAPPPDLRASTLDGHVRLEWSDPDGDDLTEIVIYRSERGKNPKRLIGVKPDVREYIDKAVKSGTVYYYSLSSLNRKKVESRRCDEVWATP